MVLVGSGLPFLEARVLDEAFAACGRVPVALGPSVDGGYYLVAQTAPGIDLFTGVPWSTPGTMAATRARLASLRVAHEELPRQRDLDTIEDLEATLADPKLDPRLRREIEAAARGSCGGAIGG